MKQVKIEAKEKIYQSPIVKYVPKEKIERAFSRIHIYENQEEWEEVSSHASWEGAIENLEGFSQADGIYCRPNITIHTIIHEVLHQLSQEVDEEGHIIINGIQGNTGETFSKQVNEGLTDYLASQISGETPRYMGAKFFNKIDPVIKQWYQDEEILYNIYLNHDVLKFKSFLDRDLKQYGGAQKIYEELLFLGEKEYEKIEKIANKNLKKHLKQSKKQSSFLQAIIRKLKGKRGILAIPETTSKAEINNRHQEFCQKYEGSVNHEIALKKLSKNQKSKEIEEKYKGEV